MTLKFEPIPRFMADYPDQAETLEQTRLPNYCCNCQRKRPTCYLTPNFGPFCADCVGEIFPSKNDTESISQEWLKKYIDTLLDFAKKVGPNSGMGQAAILRADHTMDIIKAWREAQ